MEGGGVQAERVGLAISKGVGFKYLEEQNGA